MHIQPYLFFNGNAADDAKRAEAQKAIADEGSFTSAANALGFTQPAISQMVRRLEQRTGTVLVERYGRQVRLTEAGQVLARHAVGVLAALDAAEEEITAIAGLRAGRVRLQAFPSSSATLVPRTLAILKARHPDITVTFTEAEPPESLAALRRGDCDVAVAFAYEGGDLGELEEDLSLLVTRRLMDDEVRLVVPATHPHAGDEAASLADFSGEEWIAGCPRCRGHLLSLADAAGFRPNVAFETEDYVAQLGLVTAGLGVALVPEGRHVFGTLSVLLVRRGRERDRGSRGGGRPEDGSEREQWGAGGVWAEANLLQEFHDERWGGDKAFKLRCLCRLAGDIGDRGPDGCSCSNPLTLQLELAYRQASTRDLSFPDRLSPPSSCRDTH